MAENVPNLIADSVRPEPLLPPEALTTETSVISARQLSVDDIRAWSELQLADPTSDSPFFRPEFTLALAAARDDVEVAVARRAGVPVCYFPFQRRGTVARPVGVPTSDFHGPIVHPGEHVDPAQLLRECGLAAWHYTDLVAAKGGFAPFHWSYEPSPVIDVSHGFEAYRAQRREAGSQTLRKTMQKQRKFEREVGRLRFELANRDPRVLRKLLAWKARQCLERGHFDLFSFDWVRQMLEDLMQYQSSDFSARLAALYVGDELAAAFYCLQSRHVLHVWIIAHDEAVARYSPGYQLLSRLIEHAEQLGVRRLDLGRGGERFKTNFANHVIRVADGSVDLRPIQRHVGRTWYRLRRAMGSSQLRHRLEAPYNFAKRLRDRFLFR